MLSSYQNKAEIELSKKKKIKVDSLKTPPKKNLIFSSQKNIINTSC